MLTWENKAYGRITAAPDGENNRWCVWLDNDTDPIGEIECTDNVPELYIGQSYITCQTVSGNTLTSAAEALAAEAWAD